MSPQLTDEMRHAIRSRPGQPIEVEDAQTQQVYVLVPKDSFRQLLRDELLHELQIGLEQADAGHLVDWDPEAIKAEGRRRLQASGSK